MTSILRTVAARTAILEGMRSVASITLVASALCLASPGTALACSFIPGFERFEPDALSASLLITQAAPPPTPNVSVLRVVRGKAGPAGSCADAGIIELEARIPSVHGHRLGNVGFSFRVVAGHAPDVIFPAGPVVGVAGPEGPRFRFVWFDTPPSKQRLLDLRVEVTTVGSDFSESPAAVVSVREPLPTVCRWKTAAPALLVPRRLARRCSPRTDRAGPW